MWPFANLATDSILLVGSLSAAVTVTAAFVVKAVKWARRVERSVERAGTAVAAVEQQLIPEGQPTMAERMTKVEQGQAETLRQQTELGRQLVAHMGSEQRLMRKISGRLRSIEKVQAEQASVGQAGAPAGS